MVRPVEGNEAAGLRLAAEIIEASGETPARPWLTFASERALVDGKGFLWTITQDGGTVERLIVLSCRCGHVELASFQDGLEVSRVIPSVSVH